MWKLLWRRGNRSFLARSSDINEVDAVAVKHGPGLHNSVRQEQLALTLHVVNSTSPPRLECAL